MQINPKRFFYGIGLFTLAVFMLPKFIYQCLVHKKYRNSWLQRFGIDIPDTFPKDKTIIWVHAVSVGEAKAVIPLIRKLHRDHIHWVISSTTETGYQEVKRSLDLPATQLYMPLDFGWIIRPILRQIRPALILISETDLWLNFLDEAKELRIPTALVNGKISIRSAARLKQVPFFTNDLLGSIDIYCVQDETYAVRFKELGVPQSKIHVTGNLKWDQTIQLLANPAAFRSERGLTPEDNVLVIGSTHPKEEELILERIMPIIQKHPSWKVLVVPRHPERFESVRQLLRNYPAEQVSLVDQMGILTHCYQIAKLAILGGSFVPDVGGHNILEPCQVGVAVIFGPHMHNQEQMVEHVYNAKAGLQLSLESLGSIVDYLIKNPQEIIEMGALGRNLHFELLGAADRTVKVLKPLLERISRS
jgi:3-deoxy-D-manno-octulosonic-acid transferase